MTKVVAFCYWTSCESDIWNLVWPNMICLEMVWLHQFHSWFLTWCEMNWERWSNSAWSNLFPFLSVSLVIFDLTWRDQTWLDLLWPYLSFFISFSPDFWRDLKWLGIIWPDWIWPDLFPFLSVFFLIFDLSWNDLRSDDLTWHDSSEYVLTSKYILS